MKIRCHQVVQGHSTKDAYAARLIISQKENRKDSPKSIDFSFADSRREISDDKNNYVLEIQPVDNSLQRTAAVCSQWKTVGSPSKYTHWLIPEDGNTESAFRLMNRACFMDGAEMSEYYESSKVLTMKEIEVDGEKLIPEWSMNEAQSKTMVQFLALYWSCLTKRSMGAVADIQIPLILRNENTNELLTGEQAATFFAKEIYTRMPKEAQGMISVAFGIKWSEAQNAFKKSVCAVLSTETGISPEKRIDLLNNNRDLLSKYPHDDRIAMNTIGSCLMEGEDAYPEWYIKLRRMSGGIPGVVAPSLMYICCILRELEKLDQLDASQMAYMEKCYYVIIMHIKKANGNVEEAQRILLPLAQKIILLWGQQKHPRQEYYAKKRAWAIEQMNLPEEQINDLMEPLAFMVLEEIKNSGKISSSERITDALALLKLQIPNPDSNLINMLELFISEHFEEWLKFIVDNPEAEICRIDTKSLERILNQCPIMSFRSEPEELISAFQTILSSYRDIDDTVKQTAVKSFDALWVKDKVDQLCRAEKNDLNPDADELRKLAVHISAIGTAVSFETIVSDGMAFIERHYACWIETEPAVIPEDDRFMKLAMRWAENCTAQSLKNYDSIALGTIEMHLIAVFDAYHVSVSEADRILSGFRRIRGGVCLEEIQGNEDLGDSEKASRICDLHYELKNKGEVLLEQEELEKKFLIVMQSYFRAWQNTDPPFTSYTNNQYRDNWFVTVARTWISNKFRDEEMSSSDMELLLADLGTAFKGYRVEEKEQYEIIAPILRAWGMQQLQKIRDDEIGNSPRDRAIGIAEIHYKLHSKGLCAEPDDEINRELTDEMLKVFLAWSEGEKPFPSNMDQKYNDDWFVCIAEDWIKNELPDQNLTIEEAENLENKIITVLKIYQVDEVRRNKLLANLRIRWGEEKLAEIRTNEKWDSDTVLSVAEIHDRLRKQGIDFSEYVVLEEEIKFELLEHYLEWEKASKPFASNRELKYTDDFFIVVTDAWLDHSLEGATLNTEELEKLEKNILFVLKSYRADEDICSKARFEIRRRWSNQKLDDVESDATLDKKDKALEIAGIHSQLRKLYGAEPIDNEIEEELKNELLVIFPDWGETSKPFASSNRLLYDDDWFVTVAEEWLTYSVQDTALSSMELESIEKKIIQVLNNYKVSKEKQQQMLSGLKTIWGAKKLKELKMQSDDDKIITALKIAGIHNQLRKTDGVITDELEEELLLEMLDLFVFWGKAQRPFASSENLRYEDPWFGKIFDRWVAERMDAEYYSSNEWHDLVKQLEEAIRGYHLSNVEDLLNAVKKKYADEYIDENLGNENGNNSTERMAELLFCDRIVSSEEDLKYKLINYLANNFVEWSTTNPPFKIGTADRGTLGYGSGDVFLQIYKEWQSRYIQSTVGKCKFSEIKGRVQKALSRFRIPQRSFDENSEELEYYIKRERFDEICSMTATASLVSETAGIRRWLIDHGFAQEYCIKEIEDYICDHVGEWLMDDKPMFTEGYGYTDEFAVTALDRWISECAERSDWSHEELNTIHTRIIYVFKEFKRNGIEISEDILSRIKQAETRAYINSLPETTLSSDQIRGLVDRFLSISEEDDQLRQIFIEKLSDNFKTWALGLPPFAYRSNDIESRNTLVLKTFSKWLEHSFVRDEMSFDELKQIEQNLILVLRYLSTSEEKQELDNNLVIMQTKWLNMAMSVYPAAMLRISHIASAKDRVQSRGGMLTARDDDALKRFLVNEFLPWSKEAFESENDHKKYTYDRFPEVVAEWAATEQIRTESIERIGQLENVIEKTLTLGYRYPMDECESIMKPVSIQKNNRLLEESRRNYSEDHLQMVLGLYGKYPLDYYQNIFTIYLELIKQGRAEEQVAGFLKIQGTAWKANSDKAFRKALFEFLDAAYLSYAPENRPKELLDSMTTILKEEHYDLSQYMFSSREMNGWNQHKGIVVDRFVRDLFKNTDSILDLKEKWEQQYYPLCNTHWNEIVSRATFKKELINSLRKNGTGKEKAEELLHSIGELTNYAIQEQNPEYRKALMDSIVTLIQEEYSSLSEEPQHQEYIETILNTLEHCQIDVSVIKSSNEYIAKTYISKYSQLLIDWDLNKAKEMLKNRPALIGNLSDRMKSPGKFDKTQRWLFLSLLYEIPKTRDFNYWDNIIQSEKVDLKALDEANIKDERVHKLVNCLQWNYDNLKGDNTRWLLDDLLNYLKAAMPNLWRALHPFVFIGMGNVFKKMGLDASEVSDDFSSWFIRGK